MDWHDSDDSSDVRRSFRSGGPAVFVAQLARRVSLRKKRRPFEKGSDPAESRFAGLNCFTGAPERTRRRSSTGPRGTTTPDRLPLNIGVTRFQRGADAAFVSSTKHLLAHAAIVR